MKIIGIAAEFNPFHNGHKYLIDKSKELTGATHTIAVMSGSFTQRGIPAITDKWIRAEAAIKGGIDLVLELPFAYSCNGASLFAKGATGILEGAGCVDYMCFGSEDGNLDKLINFTASISNTDAVFDSNLSYAANMGNTLNEFNISSDPNNILAVEYLKNLKNVKPFTIKRSDCGYHSDDILNDFASASKIRKMLYNKEDVSRYVPNVLTPQYFPHLHDEKIYIMAVNNILSTESSVLDQAPSAGEGIGNRLKNIIRESDNLESLIDLTRQSRYTIARITRTLAQIVMNEYELPKSPYYGRVLAFNEKGAEIIRLIKNETCNNGFRIITNINKEDITEIDSVLKYDILSADIYNLITGNDMYNNSDFVHVPVKCF